MTQPRNAAAPMAPRADDKRVREAAGAGEPPGRAAGWDGRRAPDLEARIQEVGHEIFARSAAAAPWILQSDWWEQRILEWAMHDPVLKMQLFRFVDVLPSLRTGKEVAEHLTEYLPAALHGLPAGLDVMARFGASSPVAARAAAFAARRQVRLLARRFIAGETVREAVATAQRLRRQRMSCTMDLLGEAVSSESQADEYARRYLELISGLADAARHWPYVAQIDEGSDGRPPRTNVSLKLSALCAQFDALAAAETSALVRRRLRPIFRAARERGAFVYVDMEEHDAKDLVLDIFEATLMEDEFRDWTGAGIVIQAYLKDSERDFAALLDWVRRRGSPVAVRLVKGAYWDTETMRAVARGWPCPVFAQKWETDATFERLTCRLIEHRELLRPAIASHNVRSLAHAIVRAEAAGLSPRDFEIQMLLGMGDPLKTALIERGLHVRIYTPCGALIPGMGYLIRRLLENTSNDSFLRQSFTEQVPLEVLLADPGAARPSSAPPPGPIAIDEEEMTPPFVNEPLTDFAQAPNREAFAAALGELRARHCGASHPLVVGGQRIDSEQVIDSVDPSHPACLVGRVAAATPAQADEAVRAAFDAWPSWRRTPVAERAAVLRRAAAAMRRRRFELAAWAVIEAGKPWREADADVAEAIDYCEFYAGEMERLHRRPHQRRLPGEQNVLVYEPRGVAAIIAPWNFPLAILCGMTVAALVTGNTVVIKPAEQASVIAARLFDLLAEAGVPAGAANFLPGLGEDVGARLVAHPDVAVIAFTGSRAVGLGIIETAARVHPGQRTVKRVIAEMGGKNAIIVDRDADLDDAIEGVVTSAFGYAGQKCSACSRVIVLEAVHDTFVRRLCETARSLRVGPADDPATIVGPLIDAEARERVLGWIERGAQDAQLVCRVECADAGGYCVGPVIFDHVPPHAPLAQEEVFGPVLAVITAKTFDEALAIANDTDYALTGGLYSRQPSHIERAKRELQAGVLYINRPITGAMVDRQPFGGLKLSGTGSKAGGPDYLKQFCDPKTLVENTVRHGFAPAEP
jgi:RHH-type proline utilization regulon transcriptional repressor/proline dehydrogenase/delta 1-pyrroline-5-carboxylate dehydrogenase